MNADAARAAVLCLIVGAFAAAGGYFTAQAQRQAPEPAAKGDELPADNALVLPAELKLVVGEPAELRADTRGRRVVWMSLDREVSLRPQDSKSVWVWALRPGDFRVIAWTAVGGLPTANATTIIHASEGREGEKAKP
jgi:hypothetical protein